MKFGIYIVLLMVSLVVLSYSVISTTPAPSIVEHYVGKSAIYDISDCSANPKGDCYSVKYMDASGNAQTVTGRIVANYWIDASGFLQQVPSGYKETADKRSFYAVSKTALYESKMADSNAPTTIQNPNTKNNYDSNNYSIQYHDDYSTITKTASDNNTGVTWVLKNGVLTALPQTDPDTKGSMLFYQPGSYRFGATTYVPNYEDSVFMSRLTRQSYAMPITNTTSILGGICNQYKNSPEQLEQACNRVNPQVCSSTSCCVLLGGQKCVSGDANGPTMKVNYNDPTIQKRDMYYHQGKCYGLCENDFDYNTLMSNNDNMLGGSESYDRAYQSGGLPTNSLLSDTSQTGYRTSQTDREHLGSGYMNRDRT